MKTRLNLTIEEDLLARIKAYAATKHTSLSALVEDYFKGILRPSKRKNIVQLVDRLEQPSIAVDADLKDLFYQEQAGKYGFQGIS